MPCGHMHRSIRSLMILPQAPLELTCTAICTSPTDETDSDRHLERSLEFSNCNDMPSQTGKSHRSCDCFLCVNTIVGIGRLSHNHASWQTMLTLHDPITCTCTQICCCYLPCHCVSIHDIIGALIWRIDIAWTPAAHRHSNCKTWA